MKYLFCFGYEDPSEFITNAKSGTDFESSNGVWVIAEDRKAAIRRGIDYARDHVNGLYAKKNVEGFTGWDERDFAHWIEDDPLSRWSGLALDSFDEVIA